MSRKSKIMYLSLLVVNIVIFILDMLPISFEFFRISFGISLMVMGVSLIIRAFSLKIDSSLFLGLILTLFGALNITSFILVKTINFDVNQMWPYYLFSLAFSSLVTALYFKDKLQLKLFVLFLGFGIITLLYIKLFVKLIWLFVVLMILWFVGYFLINSLLFKKRSR